MAAILALVAAFLFAVAATLQQKGALNLPEVSLRDPASLARLAGQTMWLLGTLALLTGYVFQAAALDRGRLAIIQPLLVTTVVFALPLGYFLTSQVVGRFEVIGSGVDRLRARALRDLRRPGGRERERAGRRVGDRDRHPRCRVGRVAVFAGRGGLTVRAAGYGTVAGILSGCPRR